MSISSQDTAGCGACLRAASAVEPSGDASGVDRRQFIVQSAWIAAALALAACGGSDATAPDLGAGGTITLSEYPQLATSGGIALVTLDGSPLAIVRTSPSTFLALSRICPHQGGIVGQSGSGFQCPVHGAQFSQTGQWIGGQRTSNLHAYDAVYDPANGTLTIT